MTPDFTSERLQRLIEIERSHFWFRGRRKLVEGLLRQHAGSAPCEILDLGSGGGYFCESLATSGYRMIALDFLPDGLRRLRGASPETRTVQCSAESLALRDASCDTALALDVLEHVEDRAAAAELHRVVRPGGLLLVTVPAFPWLWSYRDTAAGHKRRYRKRGLVELLAGAGFSIERVGYYQFFLFPLAILARSLGRNSSRARDLEDMPPHFVNSLFSLIARAEIRAGRFIPWPWGSSLYAIARRN